MSHKAPFLRSAIVIPPPPKEKMEENPEDNKQEGHWSDYWFEEAPSDTEKGNQVDSEMSETSDQGVSDAGVENEEDEEFYAEDKYPFNLPAVKALGDIEFGDITVLVGDNGSGKSTLVEGLAIAAGFNPEGGSRNLKFETNDTHSRLSDVLRLSWTLKPRWGWFFRAETFYGMATHIEGDDDPHSGVAAIFPELHNRSHGESFLTLIESRLNSKGLYFLDEVESALSYHGQLKLMSIMQRACDKGAQFIIATHSPLIMAFPNAKIYELSGNGAQEVEYDGIESVQLWRRFLKDPAHSLSQILD